MSFSLSPAVTVREFDLTTVVPQVATTIAAHAGVYHWGPIGKRVLVDSEDVLKTRFGKPSNLNAETWFTAQEALDAGFASHSHFTSIGTASIYRWVRPVSYQGFPDAALPEPLKGKNTRGAMRTVDGALTRDDA